jgi:hypothetical protein
MHASIWSFTGDPDELLCAYDAMVAQIPPEVMKVHLCLRAADGIVLVDTCPSNEAFDSFAASDWFAELRASAGLPEPVRLEDFPGARCVRRRPALARLGLIAGALPAGHRPATGRPRRTRAARSWRRRRRARHARAAARRNRARAAADRRRWARMKVADRRKMRRAAYDSIRSAFAMAAVARIGWLACSAGCGPKTASATRRSGTVRW